MDEREQRGKDIATTKEITQIGDLWRVPSQTDKRTQYTVNVTEQKCPCPDYGARRVKCKHLFAVELTMRGEINVDAEPTILDVLALSLSLYPSGGVEKGEATRARHFNRALFITQL